MSVNIRRHSGANASSVGTSFQIFGPASRSSGSRRSAHSLAVVIEHFASSLRRSRCGCPEASRTLMSTSQRRRSPHHDRAHSSTQGSPRPTTMILSAKAIRSGTAAGTATSTTGSFPPRLAYHSSYG
jgi:hypothetical protein